jgi:hypothetical protein
MNYSDSDKYYIFGAGSSAKILRSVLEKNGKKVISFLTSQNSIKFINNIPVINQSYCSNRVY